MRVECYTKEQMYNILILSGWTPCMLRGRFFGMTNGDHVVYWKHNYVRHDLVRDREVKEVSPLHRRFKDRSIGLLFAAIDDLDLEKWV